jgi:glycosyltransferase involved in cell wall biosynthesis
LNILYSHRTQGKGVEGVHIREIIRAWQREGHHVDIIEPDGISVLDEENKDDNKSSRQVLYKYISKYTPEIIFEIFEIFYNFNLNKKLQRALNKNRYNFMYERYALFNWMGAKRAKKARIPFILEVNYTSYTPLYRKRSKILKPLAHSVERWIFKNTDGFVVVSTHLKEHLISLGIEEEKIIILTNAADPDRFSPEISGEEIRDEYNLQGKTIIGFVGGFYPWHGLKLLLDAFESLYKNHKKIALFLIGDGPMRPAIEARVSRSGLKEQVSFAGSVPHNKLPRYIATFDIAVMPHSNEYGSPMKIYEYMAMGKPVLGPRFGPLEDGITHGVEGFLFEPGNVEELTLYLERLIKDMDLRRSMGGKGRKRVINKHNWTNNALSILKFFNFIHSDIKNSVNNRTITQTSSF